ARIGSQQRGEHQHQRRFAAAVRAHQRRDRPARGGEAQVVHRLHAAEGARDVLGDDAGGMWGAPVVRSVRVLRGLGSPRGTERLARRCGLRHGLTIARADQEGQGYLEHIPGTDRVGVVERAGRREWPAARRAAVQPAIAALPSSCACGMPSSALRRPMKTSWKSGSAAVRPALARAPVSASAAFFAASTNTLTSTPLSSQKARKASCASTWPGKETPFSASGSCPSLEPSQVSSSAMPSCWASSAFALPTATTPWTSDFGPSGPETGAASAHSKESATPSEIGSRLYGPDWYRPILPCVNRSRVQSPFSLVSAALGAMCSTLTRSAMFWHASIPSGEANTYSSSCCHCAPFAASIGPMIACLSACELKPNCFRESASKPSSPGCAPLPSTVRAAPASRRESLSAAGSKARADGSTPASSTRALL